jgi:hypothetical protein
LRKFSACCSSLGRPRQLAELGHAVDEEGDLLAEQLLELLHRRRGVLDAVVQEPGAHARHVELQLGDDPGHRQRVGDVRVPGAAGLALVGLGGEVVGPADHVEIGVGIVAGDARQDLLEAHTTEVTSNRRGYPRRARDATSCTDEHGGSATVIDRRQFRDLTGRAADGK